MINLRWPGLELSAADLRAVYRNNRITSQKLHPQISLPHYKTLELQSEAILQLQQKISDFRIKGYDVVQYDQCVFSANRYDMHHWAPSGMPLVTRSKWSGSPCVVVCGYISEEYGKVHF